MRTENKKLEKINKDKLDEAEMTISGRRQGFLQQKDYFQSLQKQYEAVFLNNKIEEVAEEEESADQTKENVFLNPEKVGVKEIAVTLMKEKNKKRKASKVGKQKPKLALVNIKPKAKNAKKNK